MTPRLTAQSQSENKMKDNESTKVDDAKPQAQNLAESTPIVWKNVAIQIALHSMALYGLYLAIFFAQYKTIFFGEHLEFKNRWMEHKPIFFSHS